MSRLALALVLAGATALAWTVAAPAQQGFTVSGWPEGISELSCDALRKNADGSWTVVAAVKAGAITIPKNATFKGTGETTMMEAKCGKK